jgi:phospholipid/cholesterol/gamma-HCH transport system substrate-binding protein
VYFLGTLVGAVADVIVDKTGRMEAQAKIRRDFFVFVRADSSAVVKKKFGVAGDSFFEITRGEGQPLPEGNASIVCTNQFQSALEAAVEEVRREAILVLKKVNGGLDTWTTLGTNLITTRERLDQLVERVDTMAADVQAGKGTARGNATDSRSRGRVKSLPSTKPPVDELQITLTTFRATPDQPPPHQLRCHPAGSQGSSGVGIANADLDAGAGRLIEALQRHWLVRKIVNQTNLPSLL